MQSFPFLGEAAALAAAFIWAVSITIYSRHGRGFGSMQLSLYKNSLGILCFLALLATGWEAPLIPDWKALLYIALSGLLGLTLGDSLFFAAIRRCGAQLATALQCFSPIFAAIFAYLVHDEVLSLRQWSGVILTLVAIIIVVWSRQAKRGIPEQHLRLRSGIVLGLISASANGSAIVFVREGLATTPLVLATTLRLVAATVGLSIIILISRKKLFERQGKSSRQLAYIALASFLGTFLGLLLFSVAIGHTKAGIASALSSSYPIWILPLTYFFLHEKVAPLAIFGTFLAVLGGVLLFT